MPGRKVGHILWREYWIGYNAILVSVVAFNVFSGYFKQFSLRLGSSQSKNLSINEVFVFTCSSCIDLICNISPVCTGQTPVGVIIEFFYRHHFLFQCKRDIENQFILRSIFKY